VIHLGELVMILDLHRQGLSISAIARQVGLDRKTVRKYIDRGLEPPRYGPRKPRSRRLEPYEPYLRHRIAAYPGLTGSRLLREIREQGYAGGYTGVRTFCARFGRRPARPSRSALRRRRVTRHRLTSRNSKSSLPTSRVSCGSFGCSRLCSVTAA
jgi:transposase